MVCAYCGSRKRWPDAFVNSYHAECWACWLRKHPWAVEHVRTALSELEESPHG